MSLLWQAWAAVQFWGQSTGCPKQGVVGPVNKAGSGVTAQLSEMTKSF